MTDEQAAMIARQYCAVTLMAQIRAANSVEAAAIATQRLEYIQALNTLKRNPNGLHPCAVRSHFYPDNSLALLNGEALQQKLPKIDCDLSTLAGLFQCGIGVAKSSIEAQKEESSLTLARRNELIGRMLDDCQRSAENQCLAARNAWEQEVLVIQSAPLSAMLSCQEEQRNLTNAREQLAAAQKEAADLRSRISMTPAAPQAGRQPLSQAVCKAD